MNPCREAESSDGLRKRKDAKADLQFQYEITDDNLHSEDILDEES